MFGLDEGKQDDPTTAKAAGTRGSFQTAGHICGNGFCLNHLGEYPFGNLPEGYKINPNTADIPGTQESAAVQAGFATWEESLSRMDFHFNGTTTQQIVEENGLSLVFWHNAMGETCAGTNWLACWTGFVDDVGKTSEFDIEFNDAYAWTLIEGSNVDVQSTAVHEAGHALGLDHIVDCAQVMGIVDADTGCGDQRALGQGDLNGVRTIYPGNFWYLRNSNSAGPPDVTPFGFGVATDTPVVGDWDGDGDDTLGIFRTPNNWFLDNGFDGVADVIFAFGSAGDKPIAGDWDGDGDVTPGVVRGTTWYLNNETDPNADIVFGYGSASDIPLAGDWDGEEGCANSCADTPGVFRPSTRQWFLNNNFDSNNGGPGDVPTFIYGSAGDTPVAGDWDFIDHCGPLADCFDDTPGVFRSPNSWFLNNGFDGTSEINFVYGRRGNKLAGDWNNNGINTIGVR